MELTIKNCNNIDSGIISITRNKLNIKFGINGTGKSTITRAIKYKIDSPELLKELLPFKHRKSEIEVEPEIITDEELNSVLIFNEEYLNQFLFKEDELISNSYEIFINTPEYKNSTEQIEQLLSEIKNVFSENENLNKIISDFENLSKSFATTQSGLSKSSALYKGLKEGNKIQHIPESLKGYSKLIKDKNCVNWLDWQNKGEQFLDISDDCPYCTSTLNSSLDTVLEKVGLLQGEINKQKRLVKILIEKHRKSINSFLTNAGYKYTVEIINEKSDNYKLLLRHIESDGVINGGKQHLSFGEKNAFSLVLFMYEALHKKPDLIVLDDPISSFDKSKKYAIMHMLFRGKSEECFLNKTVLMLTHDLDPVIDTVKVLKEFNNLCEANFLTTKNGLLSEKRITKQDLLSFAQICKSALESDLDDIVKLIYLRRNFEIIDDLGNEYQVLSNLFHKRKKAECKDQRKEIGNDLMSEADFDAGNLKIKEIIPSFEYDTFLTMIEDKENLKSLYDSSDNSYAKLNIFRLIYNDTISEIPSVLRKFINETFHIENELICQLNPNEYDLVPDFILEECDNFIIE